jgi:acyl transferase domain-containing protein
MRGSTSEGIAIIGVTGRFPGAANVAEFWRNLVAGVESISTFTDEELAASGLDVAALRRDSSYVAARGILQKAEWFDAGFFGMNAREAEVIDPQQRLFLEASWEALENAGYDPERFDGAIGVYGGMDDSTYYLNNLHPRPDLVDLVGEQVIRMGNEKDFLATRVAYKLNLRGPAINVSTACSTSLVAVCQACQSLLNYQCDVALAGGVFIACPQRRGVHHQAGGIFSPDGHCRTFDARAQGTVSSDGIGIVVLKRLAEALNDGDQLYAVIKGFGVNNDGSAKVGFTAPSVDGQAEAIVMALAQADFDPGTISYVEAHGTATPLGDPIEVAALIQAFSLGSVGKHTCALGSVKGNIGHLSAAAGVASLIKTALALKNKMLPPSLHFTTPNPKIDFANSPFFVNSKLAEWKSDSRPRRAGVSSFGLGGTNAHVVLEEAPVLESSSPSRNWQLLVLSAKTGAALDVATANLLAHFKANPDLDLADAAFTLQVGRGCFQHRRMLVCRNIEDAIRALDPLDPKRVITQRREVEARPLVFMFPGQGAQYVNMGADLYRTEPIFKEALDSCAALLLPHLGLDLREVLFPAAEKVKPAEDLLIQTRITQPALFAIEYAMARLWLSWGLQPGAMIGHSVGEYVAACLAGVFTLEDALAVVANRARMVQGQPGGAMLAVRLPETEMLGLLTEQLSIAAINSPSLCVVSGPFDAVAELEARLKKRGVAGRRLQTSHAFHSAMMEPVLGPLTELLGKVNLHQPSIPYVSNVTGRWITDSEATDARYWANHARQTVRFADGVGELLKEPESVLLEVGPSQTLSTLASQHPARAASQVVLSSLGASRDQEEAALLSALGKLWLAGATVDWLGFYKHERRRRVALPTYPFERKRYWVEPAGRAATQPAVDAGSAGAMAAAALGPKATAGSSLAQAPAGDTNATDKGPRAGSPDRPLRPGAAPSRKEHILAMLTTQFQALSGSNLADLGPSASFKEMGLDSLFLGRASYAIEKGFGIRIAFGQLLEEMATLDELADFLDQKLPLDELPAVAPPAPTMPDEESASMSGLSALDRFRDNCRP